MECQWKYGNCVTHTLPPESYSSPPSLCTYAAQALRRQVAACEACFTSSWVPTPEQAECEYVHPHEGICAYCGYCRMFAEWGALRRRVEDAERLKQGYYDEAAEGWKKFREAEARLASLGAANAKVLEALVNLTLAVGHDSGCLKLTVKCSCGKATKLTAAHQEATYFVRDAALAPRAGKEEHNAR